VVATLESIYLAAGNSVGTYTSPHLLRYNERIRLNADEVPDDVLCDAFDQVEQARGEIPLTYFEFGTLAAAYILKAGKPDVVILEVGLGGRLDAVNLFDADVAVVTSIDIDHQEWLGNSREKIGFEKAGIFRARRPAVCGDPDPPRSVIDAARETGASLHIQDRDFSLQCSEDRCRFQGARLSWPGLPSPALAGHHQQLNTATSLMVLDVLSDRLPVTESQARAAIASVEVAARFQVAQHAPQVVLDVAHNTQSTTALAEVCLARPVSGRTRAVVGMMKDKAVAESLAALTPVVDRWYLASLPSPRGAAAATLEHALHGTAPDASSSVFDDVEVAYESALSDACPEDRILVFGSFITVGAIMRHLSLGHVNGS
jgi:dihydrofolate synthase/folylpolyglutamate synthase